MPRTCPQCRSKYEDQALVCWRCRVRLVARLERGERVAEEAERVWVDLRPVYFAPDEFSALAVQRVLEEADIESRVRSVQIPWVDGVMGNIKGYWGQVLVPEEQFDQAREIVAEYLHSIDSARRTGGDDLRLTSGDDTG
jgi:hypothetical protein